MNTNTFCCCDACENTFAILGAQMTNFPGTEYNFPAPYVMSSRYPGGGPTLATPFNGGWIQAFEPSLPGNVAFNSAGVIENLGAWTPPQSGSWDKYFMAPIYPQDDCKWVYRVDNPPTFRRPVGATMGYKKYQIDTYPGIIGACVQINVIHTQHLGYESKLNISSCLAGICPQPCSKPCVVMILRVKITGQFQRTPLICSSGAWVVQHGCDCSGAVSVCPPAGSYPNNPAFSFKHCCANTSLCDYCCSYNSGCTSGCKLWDEFSCDTFYRSYYNGTDTLKQWLEKPFNLYRISSIFTDNTFDQGACGAPGDYPVCRTYYTLPGAVEYPACKTMPGGESFTQGDIDSMPCDWENIPLSITPVYNPKVPVISTVKSSDACGGVVDATGNLYGGTLITITGIHLLYASAVTIGGIPCTDVQAIHNKKVTAITPASVSAGVKPVVVTTPGGSSNAGSFTYTANAAPQTCTFTPLGGSTNGGTLITCVGANYIVGATTLTLGLIPCTSVTVLHSGALTCVTPAAVPAGYVGPRELKTTTQFGTGTTWQKFYYNTP